MFLHSIILLGERFGRQGIYPDTDPDQTKPAAFTGEHDPSPTADQVAQTTSKSAADTGIRASRLRQKHPDQLLAVIRGLPNRLGFFG